MMKVEMMKFEIYRILVEILSGATVTEITIEHKLDDPELSTEGIAEIDDQEELHLAAATIALRIANAVEVSNDQHLQIDADGEALATIMVWSNDDDIRYVIGYNDGEEVPF